MRKYYLLVLLSALLFSELGAQNLGSLRGKVSMSGGVPVEGATVRLKNTQLGTVTDRFGEYELEGLAAGDYTLVVSFTGFVTETRKVAVRPGRATDVPGIRLAEDVSELEGVTVTAAAKIFAEKKSDMVARMPLNNLENPQVYTVVPKELLEEQLATDFRGALLSSPGVTNVMLGVGSGGTGLAMKMRGFEGADGAGSIRNGMATNFVSLSDPVNLEQLEIIKGPSSTLFGSTLISYGGLVNRVTKKPFKTEKGEVGLTTGSNALGRVTLDYNKPLNEEKTFLFRINTAVHREKSFQDQGVNRTFMIAPAFKYLVDENLTLNLDLEYFQSERNTTYVGLRLPPSAGITNFDDLNWDFKRSYTSNDITSEAKVLNVFANLEYKIDEKWTSDSRVSYSNTDNNANYVFLLVKAGTGEYEGKKLLQRLMMSIPSSFNTMQFQQNVTGIHDWGNVNNKLVLGVDYTELRTSDSRTRIGDYDALDTLVKTPTVLGETAPVINSDIYRNGLALTKRAYRHRYWKTYSAYVSDVVTFYDRLNLMMGLRLDYFHDRDNDYRQTALSPKLGVVYQVVKKQLSLFANYQNGFKNVAPIALADNTKQMFRPENANQVEGGLKFELLDGKVNGTVSYYDIQVRDKVRPVFDSEDEKGNPVFTSVQDGTQESKGIEFDLIANPFKGFHVIVGYGHNESKLLKVSEEEPELEGKRPQGVPQASANYWASYKISSGNLEGLGFGFGGNYSGDYYYDNANTVKVSGFNTMDASVFFEKPKFRIGLKLNNLSNEEYWTSTYWAIPQQTRTFLANLTFRF